MIPIIGFEADLHDYILRLVFSGGGHRSPILTNRVTKIVLGILLLIMQKLI